MPPTCTPARVVFWVFAGLGWLTWILAVSATGGKDWFKNYSGFHVGQSCEGSGVFCTQSNAFKAFQILAVLIISATMIIITLSFFFSHARVVLLGRIGAGGLIAYAVLQLLAVIMVAVIKASSYWYYSEPEYGDSFGAAVTAFIFGLIGGVSLCVLVRHAGDGPIYGCVGCAGGEPDQQASKDSGGAAVEQSRAPQV